MSSGRNSPCKAFQLVPIRSFRVGRPLRIASHGAQAKAEIEHLHGECDGEKCADCDEQRRENQQLIAERYPVGTVPLLRSDLGFGPGPVDHPDRHRPLGGRGCGRGLLRLRGNRLGLRLRDRDSASKQRQAHSKAPANNPQHVTKALEHPNAAWFV